VTSFSAAYDRIGVGYAKHRRPDPRLAAVIHPFPAIRDIRATLGPVDVTPVPIPADCTDGFLGAYWRRPEAYLQPEVRQCISSFGRNGDFGPGLERLSDDVASGIWAERYGHLRRGRELDLGYRLIVANPGA
jgi:hypothetical protein